MLFGDGKVSAEKGSLFTGASKKAQILLEYTFHHRDFVLSLPIILKVKSGFSRTKGDGWVC